MTFEGSWFGAYLQTLGGVEGDDADWVRVLVGQQVLGHPQ
jgi:hypothetical protein